MYTHIQTSKNDSIYIESYSYGKNYYLLLVQENEKQQYHGFYVSFCNYSYNITDNNGIKQQKSEIVPSTIKLCLDGKKLDITYRFNSINNQNKTKPSSKLFNVEDYHKIYTENELDKFQPQAAFYYKKAQELLTDVCKEYGDIVQKYLHINANESACY